MQTVTNIAYSPLGLVTRPTLPTDAAAYFLSRQPQTLRAWECLDKGAIRPVRIQGRLAKPIAAIRALLHVGKCENTS